VASRGGTTEAALNSYDKNRIKEKLGEAYQAAFDRARELSK